MRHRCAMILALVVAALLPAADARAYADRAGTDIVMDAPWRTVRDYIPVLFFFPQFEGGRRVERIRVLEDAGAGSAARTVFVDAVSGPDTLNGVTFIGPLGEARGGLEAADSVTSFWHCVARIPHAAFSAHGTPDVHLLRAEVEWTTPALFGRRRLRNHRVLRVVVDPTPFPSFAPDDRYYDTHAHTIAEQTTSGVLNVNGAAKAYAAPVIMLLESAYALGMVETQPSENGWHDFADRVAVTDHNMFYSRDPYDTGAAPSFGPTATTDGHAGEAAWYRANLGRLAGEEITLRRGSNQDGSVRPNLGHHLLAYDAPHVEGTWHGGRFLISSLENPNTLESVLARMKAAGGTGFVYASHPHLAGFVWPKEYYAQAVGLPPHHSAGGPAVDPARGEFLFKGAEVWNTKVDAVARDNGRLPASSTFEAMNPFAGGPAEQRFVPMAWDGELRESLDTLFAYIGRGLRYSFREAPQERFIRKLYLSAGSDAHGDFNYTDEVPATAVPFSGALNRNAYASARTYVLTHERPADERDAVAAFRDGNTVITDGPLLTFSLDADGRHHPDAGAARWDDARSRWEDGDGRIGGLGRFDGGGTVLVPDPGDDVWIRSVWKRSVTPGASDIDSIRFDRVMASARDTFRLAAGRPGIPQARVLPVAMDHLAALVATVRDPAVDERCITNPVWLAPVRIEVTLRPGARSSGPEVLLPPGSLRVVFRFPISMSKSAATRALLRPLDSLGTSTDPEVELAPDPGWEDEAGVAVSRFTVTNAAGIAAPAADWDAGSHARVPGRASFVVYLERPADMHGNVLNDVARAFTLRRSEAVGLGGGVEPRPAGGHSESSTCDVGTADARRRGP